VCTALSSLLQNKHASGEMLHRRSWDPLERQSCAKRQRVIFIFPGLWYSITSSKESPQQWSLSTDHVYSSFAVTQTPQISSNYRLIWSCTHRASLAIVHLDAEFWVRKILFVEIGARPRSSPCILATLDVYVGPSRQPQNVGYKMEIKVDIGRIIECIPISKAVKG
jgi:hypothetical protein